MFRSFKFPVMLAFLLAASASAHAAVIKVVADPTITLSAAGVQTNAASIAYDPVLGLYYGSRAGFISYTGAVWDENGNLVQTLAPLGADARGWNYNSNTGNVELVTFGTIGSSLVTVGRTSSGELTGSYTTELAAISGSPSNQAMLSYNASNNVFYGIGSGPSVNVINRNTGALLTNIVLDFVAAGITSLNAHFIGFDETENVLVGVSGSAAYVFSTSGSYLGSSLLGFSTLSAFNAGYASGQLFVFDNALGGFQGYSLFGSSGISVPEPGVLALFGVGLMGMGLARRRRS